MLVYAKEIVNDICFLNMLEKIYVNFRCIDFPRFCKENLYLIKWLCYKNVTENKYKVAPFPLGIFSSVYSIRMPFSNGRLYGIHESFVHELWESLIYLPFNLIRYKIISRLRSHLEGEWFNKNTTFSAQTDRESTEGRLLCDAHGGLHSIEVGSLLSHSIQRHQN